MATCEACDGMGEGELVCSKCGGTGSVPEPPAAEPSTQTSTEKLLEAVLWLPEPFRDTDRSDRFVGLVAELRRRYAELEAALARMTKVCEAAAKLLNATKPAKGIAGRYDLMNHPTPGAFASEYAELRMTVDEYNDGSTQ